jgi:hypothetical protein
MMHGGKTMIKKIGSLLVTVLGLLLLVYSATRSLDFITLTLPADRQILAYFGLAALDGGLVCWLLAYMYGCKGGWQRAIALLMVVIDLVGAVSMFTLDTLYNTGKAGMTAQLSTQDIQTAVLALSGVVALNIASTIAHHLLDPDKLREHAEQEAFSKVEERALAQITKDAESLAAELTPIMASDWIANARARYMMAIGKRALPAVTTAGMSHVSPTLETPLERRRTIPIPVSMSDEPIAMPDTDPGHRIFQFNMEDYPEGLAPLDDENPTTPQGQK